MKASQLKDLFVSFFESQSHKQIPNSSLIPENDPTTLFISAGMHPLVPYLLGQSHPLGRRLVNVQQCLRTGDIDEVGDTYHHTFFEMLGNWSLGDYFKKDIIPWSYQFLTQKLKIDPKNLHVTCFLGNQDINKDEESANLWQKQGISKDRIHFLTDNWWGPAGVTGPCGPDTEMFVDVMSDQPAVDFVKGCQQGRFIEIWNDVFMQFNKMPKGSFEALQNPNIDTGMGVERTLAVLNGFDDNYLTDIWQPIIKAIEGLSQISYQDNPVPFRIIADHLRAAVFISNCGIEPSNKEAGYVLRRLLRKAIRQAKYLKIDTNFTKTIANVVIDNQSNYAGTYPELNINKDRILEVIETEELKFRKTLDRGLKEIYKLINNPESITGKAIFRLYESLGVPVEMTVEELKKNKIILGKRDLLELDLAKKGHILQSQTLSAGKFKSGLADHSAVITKYHTATHILHAALRQVLGDHVHQVGSNITQDRLRFDFTHPKPLTDQQLSQVSELTNQVIMDNLPVISENLPLKKAIASGAQALFNAKYPDIVSVYSIDKFSKEVCTGPHVENTGQIGQLEIFKQESIGSGKRRIYAKIAQVA